MSKFFNPDFILTTNYVLGFVLFVIGGLGSWIAGVTGNLEVVSWLQIPVVMSAYLMKREMRRTFDDGAMGAREDTKWAFDALWWLVGGFAVVTGLLFAQGNLTVWFLSLICFLPVAIVLLSIALFGLLEHFARQGYYGAKAQSFVSKFEKHDL